jgi:hypothetical protein
MRESCIATSCDDASRLSWGPAALRGLRPPDVGRYWFRPARSAFAALRAFHPTAIQPAEAGWRPTLCFRTPSEVTPTNPHGHPPVRRLASSFRQPAHASSRGLRSPFGTCRHRGSALLAASPLATASRVRGLATPFANCTTRSLDLRRLSASHASQRVKHAGAPLGFSLQGVPLDRDRSSFRSSMPSCRYPARPPSARELQVATRGRLQGLDPAASPFRHRCVRRQASDHPGRRSLLGFSPL